MTAVINAVLTVRSSSFSNNGFIPSKFTCDGSNINPSLTIGNLPDNTQSLAMIMNDLDAPKGPFDHWVVWDIQPVEKIAENSIPGIQGKNSWGENKYMGPCPPADSQHHYHFRIYALDTKLNLEDDADKNTLLKAIEGHIIASGEIIGLYKKK